MQGVRFFLIDIFDLVSEVSHMLQDLRSYHIVHMYKPAWEQLVMLKIGNYQISLSQAYTAFIAYRWKKIHVKEKDPE